MFTHIATAPLVSITRVCQARAAYSSCHHQQDERWVAQVVHQQPQERPRLDLLELICAKRCTPLRQALGIWRQASSQACAEEFCQPLHSAILFHVLCAFLLCRRAGSWHQAPGQLVRRSFARLYTRHALPFSLQTFLVQLNVAVPLGHNYVSVDCLCPASSQALAEKSEPALPLL